jgi:methyl-accepting chemotaxis protein
MFSNVQIRKFVVASVMLLAAIGIVQAGASLWMSKTLGARMGQVTEKAIPSLTTIGQLQNAVSGLQAMVGRHILSPPEETAQLDETLSQRLDKTKAQIDGYTPADAAEGEKVEAVKAAWARWRTSLDPVRMASLQGDQDGARELFNGEQEKAAKALNATLADELAYNVERANDVNVQAGKDIALATALTIAIGAIAALVTLIVFFGVRSKVTRPIAELTEAMKRMAGGNLDLDVPGRSRGDEVGEIANALDAIKAATAERARAESERQFDVQRRIVTALGEGLDRLKSGNLACHINTAFPTEFEKLRTDFNLAVETLNDVMGQVAVAANSVQNGASEISLASDNLSQRTEQQAASLEETVAAMNQVTGSVGATAENANAVNVAVIEARKEARGGGEIVKHAVEAMDEIEKSSQEITQIVSLIDGIAFQTNLLALNAGVEAARAGEAGKGFAVVATEVRALAQRSAEAAADIKKLIAQSSKQVENGVRLVADTGTSLDAIISRIEATTDRIQQIAEAAQDQASSIEQVNSAMSDMDRMTQQNAAMVEESSAAARSLAGEAQTLAHLIGRFNLTGNRAPTQARSAPVAMPAMPAPVKIAASPARFQGNLAVAVQEEDWTEF